VGIMDVFSVSSDNLFTPVDNSALLGNMCTRALSTGLDQYIAKDYNAAIATFKRAVSLSPSSDSGLNAADYMARSYLKQGDTQSAIDTYTKALKLAPSRDDLHAQLGNAYTTNGDSEKALAEYKLAAQYNPSAANLYSLGQGYLATGDYSSAIQQFQQVQLKDAKNPYGYFGLGQAYAKQGNYTDAITAFKQATGIKNDYLDAYSEMGYAYVDSGQPDLANDAISTLNTLSPSNTKLANNLSQYIYDKTKPQMTATYTSTTFAPFFSNLGPKTNVSGLSSYLANPGAQQTFAMVFQFSKQMDPSSVENIYNWGIARATGSGAADYNFDMPVPSTEVTLPSNPTSVYYNAQDQTATVLFNISQNATGNATIDPSHINFSFKGKDVTGLTMDKSADMYSGFSGFA
jgi:tetratricopeptide (TPR) repeat protein